MSLDANVNPKARCNYCTEEIFVNGGRILIRCEECPDLELCGECFAGRAELGKHRPDHPYRIIDNAGYPLLSGSWTALEQIKLLDAVEQYGYGNWEDISRSLPLKTALETKAEYIRAFVQGPAGRLAWNESLRGSAVDHTSSFPSENNRHLPPPPHLTLNESVMLGFMPERNDFEVEFDNGAEALVSQLQGGMTASPDEDEVDVALKIAHVDMYKHKLKERERRKRVVGEHELIGQFFKENPISPDPVKKEKLAAKMRKSKTGELCERLKAMADFLGPKEHQSFMASLSKEKELKQQIKDYQKYRKNGVTKIADSVEYENFKSRQNKKRLEQKKKNGDFDFNNSTSFVKMEDHNGSSSPLNSVISAKDNYYEQKNYCISELPGYDILSHNETKLCSSLKLTPAQYISYKTSLLTNHLQKKKGHSPKPLNPIGLDKNNRKIIFNFLMKAGWINAY